MKFYFLGFALLVFLASNNVMAQESLFKVLISKGANEIAAGGANSWEAIKIGKKVGESDRIKVVDGGYIGLAHSNGKTIELKKAGTYQMGKLIAEVSKQNSSSGRKYLEFVVGEMTNENENMAENRHKYMSVTGSVERGSTELQMFLPKKTMILDKPVAIKWKELEEEDSYLVKVLSLEDEELKSYEVKGNSTKLDLAKPEFKNEENLLIVVSAKRSPELSSGKYMFVKASGNLSESVLKELGQLRENADKGTALDKLVLAAFYEEQQMFADAISCYEEILKEEPDVEEFQKLYVSFLKRNKISVF